jgi:hypothetical protein
MQKKVAPQPTSPGDSIEVSITAEVKNRKGLSFWAKSGVVSQHRDGETSDQAYQRITGFVLDNVTDLTEEFLT